MIHIRRHLVSDIPLRVQWLNNPHVNSYLRDTNECTTIQKEKIWFQNYLKSPHKKFFTIYSYSHPIGFMGLSHITKKSADLFILIGEEKYHGKGLGKKSFQWLLDYGFQKLQLDTLRLCVFQKNIPALHLYTSLGFRITKKTRKEIFMKLDKKDYNGAGGKI